MLSCDIMPCSELPLASNVMMQAASSLCAFGLA